MYCIGQEDAALIQDLQQKLDAQEKLQKEIAQKLAQQQLETLQADLTETQFLELSAEYEENARLQELAIAEVSDLLTNQIRWAHVSPR